MFESCQLRLDLTTLMAEADLGILNYLPAHKSEVSDPKHSKRKAK